MYSFTYCMHRLANKQLDWKTGVSSIQSGEWGMFPELNIAI